MSKPGISPASLVFATLMFVTACFGDYGAHLTSYGFGIADIVPDDHRNRVYCSVPSQNGVVVIDSDSLAVIATIFTGSNPAGIDISPGGSHLLVANSGSTQTGITMIDLETLQISRHITTVANSRDVAVGNGVVYSLENQLRAYSLATGAQVPGTIHAYSGGVSIYGGLLRISPDRNTLYYYQTGLSPSSWYRIDVSSWPGTLVQSGSWGSNGQAMALSWDGAHITFVSGAPYHIQKRLASNPSVSLGQMDTGAYPRGATYSVDGNRIFSVNTSGWIDVWDANSYVRLTRIQTTGERRRLASERQGRVLFAGHTTELSAYYIDIAPPSENVALTINTAIELRWDTQRGVLYQIQWTSTPSANATWYDLGGPILGNGLTMSYYHNTRDSRARFYRVLPVAP